MERLTHKHDVFDYVLPEQNVVGDNQATEISLGETEYTCKKYIIGEAIKKLGELEDILESWHIESLEELKTRLNDCQVYHLQNNSNETLIHNLKNELAELKQQLAEKDKEISEYVKIVDDLHKQLSDKCDFCDKTKDQDKISFAIAELEKVKKFCNNQKNRVEYEYCHNAWTYAVDKDKLILEIDNQIVELKKEMK